MKRRTKVEAALEKELKRCDDEQFDRDVKYAKLGLWSRLVVEPRKDNESPGFLKVRTGLHSPRFEYRETGYVRVK